MPSAPNEAMCRIGVKINFQTKGRKMKTKILMIFTVLVFACQSQADTTWTTGYHEINIGETYGEIWMYNDCTLNIFGGTISRVAAYGTTVTDWYGGQMYELWAKENSIVNIHGGQISSPNGNPGYTLFTDQSIINLYAYDITYTPTGGGQGYGRIEGKYYLDNSSFILDLTSNDAYSHISIVPEPTTFMLLALGGLILRKNK